MEAFGGLLANEPSSGGKKNRLAEALKVCTVIISSEIYVYVQEKKKNRARQWKHVIIYSVYSRSLKLFCPVARLFAKKKEGDRINCLRSTYKSPHCFHVSMFPERERAVRGRPSVPGSGPDGISKDMTCHVRTWYYGLLILV